MTPRHDRASRPKPNSFGSRIILGMLWKAAVENDAGNFRKLYSVVEGT